MAPKKTPGAKDPVKKASAKKAKPKVFSEVKFVYFGFDLAKIRRYWKKIPTYRECLGYLLRCQTDIEHMDQADLLPIMERNSASFKQKCQEKADEGFHPEWVLKGVYSPSKIHSEHVRSCLLFAIKGQLDELEADTAANKKELDAYRRIDWIGTIPELRAFFEFLVDNHLIRVKNDFCVMLQDTCLHDGDKIPISTLRSAIKVTERPIYEKRKEQFSKLLRVMRKAPSD